MIQPWDVNCDNRPGSAADRVYHRPKGRRSTANLDCIQQLSDREVKILSYGDPRSREFAAAVAHQQEITRLVKQSAMEASRDGSSR